MLCIKIVSSAQIAACPIHSLEPTHYNRDGSCKCQTDSQKAHPKEAKAFYRGASQDGVLRGD